MLNVSNEFLNAMGSYPYIARITLDGTDVIQGDAVQEIYFRGGANSSEDTVLLGSAFAGSVEIALDQPSVSCAIEGRELFVELGLNLESGIEWIPMGKYTAENPTSADGVLTVKGIDALGAKFDIGFEPLDGFDFSVGGGVSSVSFLEALCARRGVAVNVAGLENIPLKVSPEGFTERQIIGFISALYGGFANIDRMGVLRIRCYTEVEAQVSADTYYEDGLEKATYSFTPGWLKCHNEAADLTLFVGDFDAQQGINLESIWINQTILNSLWERLQGFTYRPVPELSFLGNPLLDSGDILTLEDSAGEKVKVPVMTMSHEYDGGIITSIAAYGQAKTTEYQSPTRRAVIRSAESAKQYAADETAKLDQLELLKRLTKEWVDDGIYLTKEGKIGIKASSILSGVIDASVVQVVNLIAEKLKSVSGDSTLVIDGATFSLFRNDLATFSVNNWENCARLYFDQVKEDGTRDRAQMGADRLGIGSDWNDPDIALAARSVSGAGSRIWTDEIVWNGNADFPFKFLEKKAEWKDNGDGTFTLIGR